MNEYVAEITLDLDCRKNTPIIAAGQFDKGRKCLIHITANDDAYSAAGATAVIKGRYHNKSYFSEECTVDNTGNVILTISEAILAISGFVYAKIVLSDGAKTYSTQMFIIDVDDSLDGIISEFYNSKTTIITPESTHMQIPTAKAVYEAIINRITNGVKIANAYETGATVPTDGIAENDALDNRTIYRYFNINGAYIAWMICARVSSAMTAQFRFAYDGGFRYRTYSSGTWTSWYLFATKTEVDDKVPNTRKVAGIDLQDDINAAELKTALSVPTKTSDLNNDSSFMSQEQTNTAITNAISGITTVRFRVVSTLPPIQGAQSNIIYLVPNEDGDDDNLYDEWIVINNAWEPLGSTRIDLSGKVDKTRKIAGVDLEDDITAAELKTALSVPTKTSDLSNDSGFITQHQDISGKEDSANKVEVVQSSTSKSQYPSVNAMTAYVTNALSGKENAANKVTSLSSESTNTQYPSAKAVYDQLALKANSEDIPEYLRDLTDGNKAIIKYEASSAPPTSETSVSYAVPCLWEYNGDLWYVYEDTGTGGRHLYSLILLTKVIPTNVSAFINDAGYLTSHQDISGKENTSNRVTTIGSTSDNNHYPTAKAVYDYVDTVIGGIENGSY